MHKLSANASDAYNMPDRVHPPLCGWIFLILLCWAALPSVTFAAPRPYHTTRERRINLAGQPRQIRVSMRRLRAIIYRVVLPDIDVHEISFNDAIELFRQGFRECEPEHRGLGIFLMLRPGKPPIPINLTLHSASTAEMLDALCAQGNYVWCVDLYAVTIMPAEESAPIHRHLSHQRHTD